MTGLLEDGAAAGAEHQRAGRLLGVGQVESRVCAAAAGQVGRVDQ